MNTIHSEEAVGNGRARVAAGGYEYVDVALSLAPCSLPLYEILQQSCHESCTNILEGEGRTMEELKGVDAVFHLYHRTVEGKCVVDNLLQCLCFYVFSEEGVSYGVGNLLECHVFDIVEKLLWKSLDHFWHIESTVFCQSFHHCFLQRRYGCLVVCAVVFHAFAIILRCKGKKNVGNRKCNNTKKKK